MLSNNDLYRMAVHLHKTEGYGSRKISRILGISRSKVGSWLYSGCKPWREPKLYPSKALSYVLGVLLGDGCVTIFWNKSIKCFNHRIILNTKDKEFADAFSKALRKIRLNARVYYIKRENIWMVTSENKKFATWYKALTLQDIEKIVELYTPYFVRGFYDSEGSCVVHDDGYICIQMWNTRQDILRMMKAILCGLKFHIKVSLHRDAIEHPNHIIDGRRVKSMKDLYVLKVLGGKSCATRFLNLIKPTIQRKLKLFLPLSNADVVEF